MKKILVTGNEGYIGSILTQKLIERGYGVVGLDSGIFKDTAFIPRAQKPHEQRYQDIRDIHPRELEDIYAIIHLAGLCNDALGHLNPALTLAINHEASVILARHAKKTGVARFLFSSSCSIYGILANDLVNENSSLNPQTPYAQSKVNAEKDIALLANNMFSPIFLRNATVFGISPRLRLDLVVQDLTALGYLSGIITLLSDGTAWRPLVHVSDVADAFIFLLEAPVHLVHNQAFNVGSKKNNFQIKTIAQMVRSIIPGTKIKIKNKTPQDTRSYKVDFSKLYSLGFKPMYSVHDGITELYRAFKEQNLQNDDLNSDLYITLKRYRTLLIQKKMTSDFRVKNL